MELGDYVELADEAFVMLGIIVFLLGQPLLGVVLAVAGVGLMWAKGELPFLQKQGAPGAADGRSS